MNPLRLTAFASSPEGGTLSIYRLGAKKLPPFGGAGIEQSEMTERVLLPLRQRHTQHQTDADGQRNGYLKVLMPLERASALLPCIK